MCNYKKNKELLDTLNGPITPYAKLNRQKQHKYQIKDNDMLHNKEQIDSEYQAWIRY